MLVISWDVCPSNVLIVLSCKDTVLPAIYCKYKALQFKQLLCYITVYIGYISFYSFSYIRVQVINYVALVYIWFKMYLKCSHWLFVVSIILFLADFCPQHTKQLKNERMRMYTNFDGLI